MADSNSTAPTLHDLATKAEELAIPLDAAADLITEIIGRDAMEEGSVYLIVALRAVIKSARTDRRELTDSLYALAHGGKAVTA